MKISVIDIYKKYSKLFSPLSSTGYFLASILIYFSQGLSFLTPNIITMFSFFVFLIGCFTLVYFKLKFVFILLIFISFIFDAMDGMWARLKNQGSSFGAWLDPVIDAVKMGIMFFSIFLLFRTEINMIYFLLLVISYFLLSSVSDNTVIAFGHRKNKNIKNKKINLIGFGPGEEYFLFSILILFPNKNFLIISFIIFYLLVSFYIAYKNFSGKVDHENFKNKFH